jgi:hypothetical protein
MSVLLKFNFLFIPLNFEQMLNYFRVIQRGSAQHLFLPFLINILLFHVVAVAVVVAGVASGVVAGVLLLLLLVLLLLLLLLLVLLLLLLMLLLLLL